jgi:hypothetical protein
MITLFSHAFNLVYPIVFSPFLSNLIRVEPPPVSIYRIRWQHLTLQFEANPTNRLPPHRKIRIQLQPNRSIPAITCTKPLTLPTFRHISIQHLLTCSHPRFRHRPITEVQEFCFRKNGVRIPRFSIGPLGSRTKILRV